MREKDSREELYARLDDLKGRAERGEMAISQFLTPAELHFASRRYSGASVVSFGGYEGAERRRMYFLPEYMEGSEPLLGFEEFGISAEIVAVEICGSGYKRLSHRDFLGSVLGLGLSRDVLGDIILSEESENRAIAFCDEKIAHFIEQSLERVGNDKVKVKRLALEELNIPKRKFLSVSDTVASPRFDCVVAALCSLSRAKAAEVISAGLAELDYECEERTDRQILPPCVISVRGYGKFAVRSVSDVTKKGRFRLFADKYV